MAHPQTPSFQVHVSNGPNVAIYPPGACFGPRELRDFEFVWLLDGNAHYIWQNEVESGEIQLAIGQLLLCRKGERDEFVWDTKNRTRHGFFHFSLDSRADFSSWPRVRPMDEDTLFAPLARHLLTWSEQGNSVQRDLCASLFLTAFVGGQISLGDVPSQVGPEPVERALEFLFTHLDSDAASEVTLENLARVAFVTPEHLCRLFKNSTGHSPLETVRLARLDRAAMLLSRTNFSVAQVAQLTGFVSPFHFSRAFKEAYGASPRALRQNLDQGQALPPPRLLRVWKQK